MGCDIHTRIEVRRNGQWTEDGPVYLYHWHTEPGEVPDIPTKRGILEQGRSYRQFGVLADVRNYSKVGPLLPRRGIPEDSQDAINWYGDGVYHSGTWYTLHELLTFNWEATCEDRRGLNDQDEERGPVTTYREFLRGNQFFEDIETLRVWAEQNCIEPEDVRIIIAFDN